MTKLAGKHTPATAARALRLIFEDSLPTHPCDRGLISAYEFCKMVQEQTGCTFRRASLAVQKAIPEVYADHWHKWIMERRQCQS